MTQMNEKDRWNETREALLGISKFALDHKSGEIDLKFLNSSDKTASIKVRTNQNKSLMPRFDDVIKAGDSILTHFDAVKVAGKSCCMPKYSYKF